MANSITYTPKIFTYTLSCERCSTVLACDDVDHWLNKFSSHFLFRPLTYHGLLPNRQIPPRPCQRPPTGCPDHCLRLRSPSCPERKAHPRRPWLHHRCHCCRREVGCKWKLTLVVQLNGKARLGETKGAISMPSFTDSDFSMKQYAGSQDGEWGRRHQGPRWCAFLSTPAQPVACGENNVGAVGMRKKKDVLAARHCPAPPSLSISLLNLLSSSMLTRNLQWSTSRPMLSEIRPIDRHVSLSSRSRRRSCRDLPETHDNVGSDARFAGHLTVWILGRESVKDVIGSMVA